MPRRNHTVPYQPYADASNCRRKRRFAKQHEAEKAAELQVLIKTELELSVYKCEVCGGWHLTSQTAKK